MLVVIFSPNNKAGFGYIETLVALVIFAITSLSLFQISLSQAQSQTELERQLLTQQLLSSIQARLKLNKSYILQQKGLALYFSNSLYLQDCPVTIIDSCNLAPCDKEQIAKQDIAELSCLALEAQVLMKLELVSAQSNLETIEIAIEIVPKVDSQLARSFTVYL